MILDANGLGYVPIEMVAGTLTDHYDPKNDVMGGFQVRSITAHL